MSWSWAAPPESSFFRVLVHHRLLLALLLSRAASLILSSSCTYWVVFKPRSSKANTPSRLKESRWEYPEELLNQQSAAASQHWVEKWDKNSGNYYYYNKITKETTWEKPANFKSAADSASSDWSSKVSSPSPCYNWQAPVVSPLPQTIIIIPF